MNEEKKMTVNVTVPENYSGEPINIVYREGKAPDQLPIKAPIPVKISGVIDTPAEFLLKRMSAGQFEIKNCHIIVDRDNIEIMLVTNETDALNRAEVVGKLEFNSAFKEFGINSGKSWTPNELGLFFKMNRGVFADRSVNMKLVTELMNFTATVNNKIERSIKESGDRTDNFAQVVNSNLPASFVLDIQIFKGGTKEQLEVETFANVNGREVSLTLISPAVIQTVNEIRDKIIDDTLEEITRIAPDIAIIEK